MSDLVITPANVFASGGAEIRSVSPADVDMLAGTFVYLEDGATRWKKVARNLVNSAADNSIRGITLNHAYASQPVAVAILDTAFLLGATLVAGTTYAIGSVAGAISPFADLSSGDYPVIVGQAVSTTELNLYPLASGIAIP